MSAEHVEQRLQGLARRVREVQRWLMLLYTVRTLAGAGAFSLLYLVVFSALDHRFHFGAIPRVIALAGLIAGVIAVAYWFGRGALRHYSTQQAASYIERFRRYDQQLVTAIEYYEDRDGYPYSRALVERIVVQIDNQSRDHDFAGTVPKWQVYASSAVIAVALLAVCIALIGNAAFFSRYFARLVQPLAQVEPIPATTLEALTGDIVTQPDFNVTLAAAIGGKVPENGLLHLMYAGEQYETTPATYRTLTLAPSSGEKDQPQFASTVAFPLGAYRYQFESGEAKSAWQNVMVTNLPEFKSLRAKVKSTAEGEAIERDLEGLTLDVLEGSQVTLVAEATEPLKQAVVVDVDGNKAPITTNGAAKFEHSFTPTKAGLINFELTSAAGLTHDKLPPLQLALHADQPPVFKLVTPQGDYLATNVASIPLRIDVTDDFGLSSAALVVEIAGQEPMRMAATLERGAHSATLTRTLELEEYDLALNDTIIYYAEASDVSSGIKKEGEHAASDLYLIEIKPYQQVWHQPPDSLPSDFSKQGLNGGANAHATLKQVLEVSRAILKKTWPLANKNEMNVDDKAKTAALGKDVSFNAQNLGKIITDPRYRFTAEQATRLENAKTLYLRVSQSLIAFDAKAAIEPEKRAYQDIRSVLDELEKALMSGGGGGRNDGPEGVKLEEQVHLARFEKEQTEWELKELSNKLERIRQEQKALKERYERFLKGQGKQESASQQTTDEKSWTDPNAKPQNDSSPTSGGADAPDSRSSVEGTIPPGSQQSGQGGGESHATAMTATEEDLLEVMRANQRALQERLEQLQDATGDDTAGTETPAEDRVKAREHLSNAIQEMKKVDAALSDALFGKRGDAAKRASDAFDAAQRELELAAFLVEQARLLSEQERAAKELQRQAEMSAEIARALEEADSERDYAEQLVHLRDAWTRFGQHAGSEYVGHHGSDGGLGAPPNFTVLAHPLVPTTDKSNIKPWRDPGQIRAARWLASQYSTLAIEAERLRGELRSDDASDVEFTGVEKTYFEKAAAYEPGVVR